MNEVILNADGMLTEHNGAHVADALRALGARVSLTEGYCLRSFMRMLLAYPVLTRLSDFAPEFVEKHGSWPQEGCLPAGLERLEFSRVVELTPHAWPLSSLARIVRG